MSRAVKVILIVSATLVVLWALLLAVRLAAGGWRFLGYEENTHEVNGAFEGISLKTITADVILLPAEDGVCRVVCREQEKVGHRVTVENGTLTIAAADERKWYDYITLFSVGKTQIKVYLPSADYASLVLEGDTGDVEIPKDFAFESIDISLSTGDVTNCATAESVRIKTSTGDVSSEASAQRLFVRTSTGDISVQNAAMGALDLSVSTGRVTVSSVACTGSVSISVSTGKTHVTDVTCQSLVTTGDTGDITLENVIASETFSIKRSTGDVRFEACDAAELFVETDTGSVKGTLLTEKIFFAQTDTGKVNVPKSVSGGRCEIVTSTGSISMAIASNP